MQKRDKKDFETIISRTKIYLAIIAIVLVLLCIKDINYIIPSIVLYILILIYTFWVNNKRKTEITKHIQELTGNVDSAAKNTLINSPFPLVIVETNGNIIWKSSKFTNEFANEDIGSKLVDFVKEIKQEIDSSRGKKIKTIQNNIKIGKKTYKVVGEYVKNKQKDRKKQTEYIMILYFIDNTETVKLEKKYEDTKVCLGIIKIDNYEETMQRLSNEQKPQVIAEIEKIIYEWANKTHGVVIKTERETFVYVFEQKYLEKLKENKFDLLDTAKEINAGDTNQITFSISVSNEGKTIYEKYKSALSGMDIVLGRGGDQAVVRENEKYNFFGGRSKEIEKRTRVKARVVSHALEELIKEAKEIMIMGHQNPDIDAIGSSLGIFRFSENIGKKANIVTNLNYGPEISSFMEELNKDETYKGVFIDKAQAIANINEDTLVVVVDTHKRNFVEVPELLEKAGKIVVIDHHRRSTDYIDNAILMFHEVYASSASELVTELIEYAEKEIVLPKIEAEALYGGIVVDTKNFAFKTGVRTFEAAAYLRKCGIDILKVKKWFQSNLDGYNKIAEIVKNVEIIAEGVAISIYNEEDKNASVICAKSADELLTISEINASFVIGNLGDKVCISGRSVGDINVQVILEKLGGGGHITLAGAQVEDMTCEEVKQELVVIIKEYLEEMVN